MILHNWLINEEFDGNNTDSEAIIQPVEEESRGNEPEEERQRDALKLLINTIC
jgi:hypothetical protein